MNKPWGQWIAASGAAGTGGVFALLTYVHANFVSIPTMEQHIQQPHRGSVSVERYNEDIRYLRKQISEINSKLDRALGHR